jgi:hypothetical protein
MKANAMRAAELAEKRRAARIARKVAREQPQANGLDDLSLEIAVAIEVSPEQPVKPEPAPIPAEDSVLSLVSRLTAIREKIWRLQAMYAVSLSHDCLMESDRYLILFQDLAEKLREKDKAALDSLTFGHECSYLRRSRPSRAFRYQRRG